MVLVVTAAGGALIDARLRARRAPGGRAVTRPGEAPSPGHGPGSVASMAGPAPSAPAIAGMALVPGGTFRDGLARTSIPRSARSTA